MRYNYGGVGISAWRKKKNWQKNDKNILVFNPLPDKRPIDKLPWFCKDENNSTMSTLATKTLIGDCPNLSETEIESMLNETKFTGYQNCKKMQHDEIEWVPERERAFFDTAYNLPLSTPCQFLQTPMDGSCFYSVVSWVLYGTFKGHYLIRNTISDYMESNHSILIDRGGIPSSECQAYITKHRNLAEYADHLQIFAAAKVFNINIFVYTLNLNDDSDSDSDKETSDNQNSQVPDPSWRIFIPGDQFSTEGNIYMKLIRKHYMLITGISHDLNETAEKEGSTQNDVSQLVIPEVELSTGAKNDLQSDKGNHVLTIAFVDILTFIDILTHRASIKH